MACTFRVRQSETSLSVFCACFSCFEHVYLSTKSHVVVKYRPGLACYCSNDAYVGKQLVACGLLVKRDSRKAWRGTLAAAIYPSDIWNNFEKGTIQ